MKKQKRKKKEKKKKFNPIDAWVEANFERLALNPNIQKLFGIKKDEALDLVSKELKDEKREKNDSSVGLEPFKVIYTEKEIKELATILKWIGNGTENDPLIINSTEGLPQKFSISVNFFLDIKDCSFDHIILYDCQNVSIENCSFNTLGVLNTSEISVKRGSLSNLNLDHCTNSYFKECTIAKVYNYKSRGNTFENCNLTNEIKDKLIKSLNGILKLLKQLPWIILATGCGIAVFTFLYILNSTTFGLYWYLSTITFIGLVIVYILLLRYLRKLPPNKIL